MNKIIKFVQWFEAYLGEHGLRNLLTVHFSICSAGLIVVLIFIAGLLGKVLHPPEYLYSNLFPWAQVPVGVKTTSLLQFILPVVMLFAYYPLSVHWSQSILRTEIRFDKDRFPGMWAYILAIVVVNAGLLLANKEKMEFIGVLSVLWLLFFLWFPFCILRKRWLTIPIPKWSLWVVLGVILVQYAAIFVPLITNPMKIANDYLYISGKTILKSGMVVDNLDFINEHKLTGGQLYDPRKENSLVAKTAETKKQQIGIETLNELFTPPKRSDEEKDFIDKNEVKRNTHEQKGWFFYHHGYNFGPMHALSLGASLDRQTLIYGWLSTVTQGKLLESFGMMNYQGYFKEFFSIYLIYFAIYLLGIWLIFKRLDTLVFAGILAISALLELGVELIKLGPGFNPVRHIFDVPAFYLLYRYLVLDRKTYLLFACGLACFAILWNKDFGLFLSLSVGGAAVFKGSKQLPFQLVPLFIGSITVVVGTLLYFYPMPGANPLALYMLMGSGSPPVPIKDVFHLLILISALLVATILVKQSEAYKILTWGFAFYFVQSLIYYIWYPKSHHLFGIAPVFIFWLAALYNGWISNVPEEEKLTKLQSLFLILLIFVCLSASIHFYKYQNSYNQTFKNHQLYEWTFEDAAFKSTMEPELFEEAANLIKQYSPNNKGIYIISKYDNLLPVLAGRYSAMPFNELLISLVSPKEVDVAAQAILTNRPQFLFIDSDIGNALDFETPLGLNVNAISNLFGSISFRETPIVLGLSKVYMRVEDKYKRCVPGKLVSVYCRSSD